VRIFQGHRGNPGNPAPLVIQLDRSVLELRQLCRCLHMRRAGWRV